MTCNAKVCPEYAKFVDPKDKQLKAANDLVSCMPGMQKRIEELEDLLRKCAEDMQKVRAARESLNYSLEKIPDKNCDAIIWAANMTAFMALMKLDSNIEAVTKLAPPISEKEK